MARRQLRILSVVDKHGPLRLSVRHFAAPSKNKQTKADKKQQRLGEEAKDEAYELYRSIMDSPKRGRPEFSKEQYAKHFEIGREYNRQMCVCPECDAGIKPLFSRRMRHDRFNAGLQLKLDIQHFALQSLPPDLRAHANSTDDLELPPLDRRWWSWTPPIPGFDPRAYADTDTS